MTYWTTSRCFSDKDPQGNVTASQYDAAGNQVTHLDADNRTDTTTPDAANRAVQDVATAPGPGGTAATGTVITTTNTFDSDGNTVSASHCPLPTAHWQLSRHSAGVAGCAGPWGGPIQIVCTLTNSRRPNEESSRP